MNAGQMSLIHQIDETTQYEKIVRLWKGMTGDEFSLLHFMDECSRPHSHPWLTRSLESFIFFVFLVRSGGLHPEFDEEGNIVETDDDRRFGSMLMSWLERISNPSRFLPFYRGRSQFSGHCKTFYASYHQDYASLAQRIASRKANMNMCLSWSETANPQGRITFQLAGRNTYSPVMRKFIKRRDLLHGGGPAWRQLARLSLAIGYMGELARWFGKRDEDMWNSLGAMRSFAETPDTLMTRIFMLHQRENTMVIDYMREHGAAFDPAEAIAKLEAWTKIESLRDAGDESERLFQLLEENEHWLDDVFLQRRYPLFPDIEWTSFDVRPLEDLAFG